MNIGESRKTFHANLTALMVSRVFYSIRYLHVITRGDLTNVNDDVVGDGKMDRLGGVLTVAHINNHLSTAK